MMPRTDVERRIAARLAQADWGRVTRELDSEGWSRLGMLITHADCAALIRRFGVTSSFRSTVDMARHRFGRGEYRYFAYPLPPLVAALRTGLYPHLATIANRWAAALGGVPDYPTTLAGYLACCH